MVPYTAPPGAAAGNEALPDHTALGRHLRPLSWGSPGPWAMNPESLCALNPWEQGEWPSPRGGWPPCPAHRNQLHCRPWAPGASP